MTNKTTPGIRNTIFSFVFLLIAGSAHTQSCPLTAGDYTLNTQNASAANKVRQTESGGVVYNQIWCPYKAPNQPGISFYVDWISSVPNNSYISPWTCMTITSSKDVINLENKQAYATFSGYSVNDEYRRGLMKANAQLVLQQVAPLAYPCPNASINNGDGNNTGNTEICSKNFKSLTQLLEKKSGVHQHINNLEHNTFNETTSRNNLSRYNKFLTALKDPLLETKMNNDPHYLYRIDKELDRLNTENEYRTQQANSYGLNPDAPPEKIIRTMRDITAAQIDYYKDVPTFLQRAKQELSSIEKQIEKLHAEIRQLQCAGDFDINSCDLSGEWTFTRWDPDPDNGTDKETWIFTPVRKGFYSALNKKTGQPGEAEIFGKKVKLTVRLRADYTIIHGFLLDDVCFAGIGSTDLKVAAMPKLTVQRNEKRNTGFTSDRLYDITFRGNNYQAIYERQTDNAVPIDILFFSINYSNGTQVEQNGEKLWGRFVRKPAADHPDQSNVQWWFSNWVFENGLWIKKDEKIPSAPAIR